MKDNADEGDREEVTSRMKQALQSLSLLNPKGHTAHDMDRFFMNHEWIEAKGG